MSEQTLFTALHQICAEIRDEEIENLKSVSLKDKQKVTLNQGQILELSERVQSLPQACRDILLARYCYTMDAEEIENLYSIDDARGKCLYAEKLLGYALDLKDDEMISPESLTAACKAVDERISNEIRQDAEKYKSFAISRKHKRKMNDILRRGGKPSILSLTMRYAAMFALVLLLSGAITLSVNAELREKFFNWVVSTYREFSVFGSEKYLNGADDLDVDGSDMQIETFDHTTYSEKMQAAASYAPSYIPEGYCLSEEIVLSGGSICKRKYADTDGRQITFSLADSESATANMDTEDSEIQTITLFGQDAFVWQRRGMTFVVFQIDGFISHIISETDIDMTVSTAESVKQYENINQADSDKSIDPLLLEIMRMRPKYVPQEMSLASFDIDVNLASYFYTDEYGLETAVYVQRVEKVSGDTSVSGFTEWPVRGYFQTWDYGNYKCMINSSISAEETKKMALSMQYDK